MQEFLSAHFCKFYRLTVAVFLFLLSPGEAQDTEPRNVVVEADELLSAYGAPPDLSRGRISTLAKAFVLPPYHVELENFYGGNFVNNGLPRHIFTTEIEMGLPGRFTVGIQNHLDRFNGETQERDFTLEARHALADWNKIYLNPTIAGDYRFGFDRRSDAIDVGLLLCHDFAHMIEWAANISGEKTLESSRAPGFRVTQTCEIPVLLPDEQLEVGIEMQYLHREQSPKRHDREEGFEVGPTLAWRPTKTLHVDLSPLIGCTGNAPRLDLFAAVSFSFGGPESSETETPASARGH
jgi:hypothetical protein